MNAEKSNNDLAECPWNDGWPDWGDAGRRVVFEDASGNRFEGTLVVADVGIGGEDEFPMWECSENRALDFVGAIRWRFA